MTFPYNPSIPKATDFPANSQQDLFNNFTYLCKDTTSTTGLTKDHYMTLINTNAMDGMHRQVTMGANLSDSPGFSPGGVSVIYPKTAQSQSQLFFDNGTTKTQLTSTQTNVPTSATNGVSFLPGGMLMIWNQVAISANQTVTFTPVSFSAAPYVIFCSFVGNGTFGFLSTSAYTSTNFFVQSRNVSNAPLAATINWIAIGPA